MAIRALSEDNLSLRLAATRGVGARGGASIACAATCLCVGRGSGTIVTTLLCIGARRCLRPRRLRVGSALARCLSGGGIVHLGSGVGRGLVHLGSGVGRGLVHLGSGVDYCLVDCGGRVDGCLVDLGSGVGRSSGGNRVGVAWLFSFLVASTEADGECASGDDQNSGVHVCCSIDVYVSSDDPRYSENDGRCSSCNDTELKFRCVPVWHGLYLHSLLALPLERRGHFPGLWHSWLARILDMDEVVGSNPTNPTRTANLQKVRGSSVLGGPFRRDCQTLGQG